VNHLVACTSYVFTYHALPTPAPNQDAEQEGDHDPGEPRALLEHIIDDATQD
jgi:hypothetical protein